MIILYVVFKPSYCICVSLCMFIHGLFLNYLDADGILRADLHFTSPKPALSTCLRRISRPKDLAGTNYLEFHGRS